MAQNNNEQKLKLKKIIGLLAIVLAGLILTICVLVPKEEKLPTNEELIESKITTFVTAYNDGDMENVLSCLDTKTRNAFQAMLNILGGLAGSYAGFDIDLSELFSLGISTASGDFMDLEISDITIKNNTSATATTTMNLVGTGSHTIYFEMVYENNDWYIHNMSDEKKGSINNPAQTGKSIEVLEINSVDNGNATIEFQMDDTTYVGVINANGEIIYYVEENYIYWTSIGKGAGFVTKYMDNNQKSYIIFNEEGNKTLTVDGEHFDTIIGYGDGLMLVYKNTSTITTEEHCYGVLDGNGNWVKELTAGTKLPEPDGWNWETFDYIGDGVFSSYNYYGNNDHYILFNAYTNKSYFISSCYIFNDCFANGVIYGKNTGWGLNPGYISDYSNQSEYTVLPSYFALRPDGTFVEVEEFSYAYDNLLINKKGEYMRILDKTSNVEKEYTAIKSNMITSIKYDTGFILITLKGLDNKTYFTLIDKNCNQLVAPTVCKSANISNGRIIYTNTDNIYEVIDVNGNTIISKNEGYTFMSNYEGGIARAKNSEGEGIIGLDGKPLDIKLK